MKKKLLTTVLTVSVVLSLVGCGAKETTSSESVAETTEVTTEYGAEETSVEEVVEETTVAETEVEEPVKEKIPVDITDGAAFMNQVIENYKAQKYAVLEYDTATYDVNDPTVCNKTYNEFLYDWNNNVAGVMGESSIMYYDFTEDMSYISNVDMTGFYKLKYDAIKDSINDTYTNLTFYVEVDNNFIVTEVTDGEYANYYCATNEYAHVDNTDYSIIVKVYVDPYTLLPVTLTMTECDLSHELVLEDGTTVTGEYFVNYDYKTNFQFLTEEDADFATFQSAIQLPAEDEYTLVEGEITTTE